MGDPKGLAPNLLRQLRILDEKLLIDLRSLANPHANVDPTVTAEYHVFNSGGEIRVPLLFVAPGLRDRDNAIMLDGQPVLGRYVSDSEQRARGQVPDSWRIPNSTPVEGGDRLPLPGQRQASGVEFVLTLSPGEHRIEVTYRPEVHGNQSHTVIYWQFAYSLAPAREWGSFDSLHVQILHPAGWIVTVEPGMRRSAAGELRGEFRGVPADAIALTAHAPEPAVLDVYLYELLGFVLIVWIMLLAATASGRTAARRGHIRAWRFPLAFLVSIVLASTYLFFFLWASYIPYSRAGLQSVSMNGYGEIFEGFAAWVVAWVVLQIVFTTKFRKEYDLNRGSYEDVAPEYSSEG